MSSTTLITGFDEAVLLLREGDEIVAIIPDSLAYGDQGSPPVVPPKATLVYDKFKIVKVDEPKGLLSDSLLISIKTQGIEKAIEQYNTISTSADSSNYHRGIDEYYNTWEKLSNENMHQEAADMAIFFGSQMNNKNWMRSLMIKSLGNLGQTQQAIDSLQIMLEVAPDNEYLNGILKELQEKIKTE